MEAVHAFAREGDVENLLKCIGDGVSVDIKGIFIRHHFHLGTYSLLSGSLVSCGSWGMLQIC